MKKLFKMLMAGSMAVSMAACSSSSDSGTASSSAEDVSVFYYTYADTYISSVRSALDADLTSAGINYVDYDSNNSQTTQTEQVQTAISKGTKCLVVNLVDSSSDDAASNIVKMAEDAGIPVVFFNRSVSEEVISAYDNAAYVGTDYEQAGKMQGDLIGQYLVDNYDAVDLNGDGVISYVMLKGDEANAEAIARTKYAVENANAVLEAAGKSDLSYYDSSASTLYLLDQNGTWSSSAGHDLVQTVLAQYSEANGNMVELVIANNDDMALGAITALQEAGYNNGDDTTVIPVFGVDATEAAVTAIDGKTMTGTIKQDAEGMASAVCTIVQNLMNGNDKFADLDSANVVGTWRINIPYSTYSGE
jgi:methyl-galactoside transport system substrate-binding protein